MHLERERLALFSPWFWRYWCSEFGSSGTPCTGTQEAVTRRPKNRKYKPSQAGQKPNPLTSGYLHLAAEILSIKCNIFKSAVTYHHPPQQHLLPILLWELVPKQEMVVNLLVFVGKTACCPVLTLDSALQGRGWMSSSLHPPAEEIKPEKTFGGQVSERLSGWIKASEVLKHEV